MTQTLPEERPQTFLESTAERFNSGIGKATYTLEDPALQFTYDPESFVLETFDGATPETNNRAITLWSKEDYLTIKNAGDELGDFPTKLRLEVLTNPDGTPVVDWLEASANDPLMPEMQNIQPADIAVAGQDAWTFSYRSLFDYEGIAFQDEDGRIVLITAYKPPANSTSEGDEAYLAALSTIVESVELAAAVPE